MKFQDDISMPHSSVHTYIHTYIHTYGQAETNMSLLFQSWGHKNSHTWSTELAALSQTVATQQPNRNKHNVNKHKVKRHRKADTIVWNGP